MLLFWVQKITGDEEEEGDELFEWVEDPHHVLHPANDVVVSLPGIKRDHVRHVDEAHADFGCWIKRIPHN